MRNFCIFFIATLLLTNLSCSEDDNNSSQYPKNVNIEYEAVLSKNVEINITTIVDNETQFFEGIFDSIFSEVYVNKEVSQGTFLRLVYEGDDTFIVSGSNSQNWEDYSLELNIYVDGEVVANETFTITLDNVSGTKFIDYTFN